MQEQKFTHHGLECHVIMNTGSEFGHGSVKLPEGHPCENSGDVKSLGGNYSWKEHGQWNIGINLSPGNLHIEHWAGGSVNLEGLIARTKYMAALIDVMGQCSAGQKDSPIGVKPGSAGQKDSAIGVKPGSAEQKDSPIGVKPGSAEQKDSLPKPAGGKSSYWAPSKDGRFLDADIDIAQRIGLELMSSTEKEVRHYRDMDKLELQKRLDAIELRRTEITEEYLRKIRALTRQYEDTEKSFVLEKAQILSYLG